MIPTDAQELLRLTTLLESLHEGADLNPDSREALKKAALALSITFIHGLRPEMEEAYSTLEQPLPDGAREHLRRLGIDPDEESES